MARGSDDAVLVAAHLLAARVVPDYALAHAMQAARTTAAR